MNIEIDDGLNFGLGVFETILLRNGRAVFLDEHLTRINNSIENLKIKFLPQENILILKLITKKDLV